MNNTELAELIRNVAKNVDNADEVSITEAVQPLRDVGIEPGCHLGRGAEMVKETEEGYRLGLEWYAGQIFFGYR